MVFRLQLTDSLSSVLALVLLSIPFLICLGSVVGLGFAFGEASFFQLFHGGVTEWGVSALDTPIFR